MDDDDGMVLYPEAVVPLSTAHLSFEDRLNLMAAIDYAREHCGGAGAYIAIDPQTEGGVLTLNLVCTEQWLGNIFQLLSQQPLVFNDLPDICGEVL
jgi:hypothetical protein